MAEGTAAALMENMTVRGNSVRRGGEDSFDFAESVVFGGFEDFDISLVANGR